MEHRDIWRHLEAHGGENFATLADWCAGAEGLGKLGPYLADHAGAPETFRTFKALKARGGGYVDKALPFPEAVTFADLFEAARYTGQPQGALTREEASAKLETLTGGPGFRFVGGGGLTSGAPMGHVGGTRYITPQGIPGRRGSVFSCTYARPRPEVVAWWESRVGPADDNEFGLGGFEVVRRSDGTSLVIARSSNGIASRWLALLPPGADIADILPQADRDVIAQNKAADRAAWPRWDVTGTERAKGAQGVSEPFSVQVVAESANDAQDRARANRYGALREHVLITAVKAVEA